MGIFRSLDGNLHSLAFPQAEQDWQGCFPEHLIF
jgi:hypothetical protein